MLQVSSVRVFAIEMFEVMAIMCRLFIGKYAVSHENGQTEITQRVTHSAHQNNYTSNVKHISNDGKGKGFLYCHRSLVEAKLLTF